MPPWRPPPTLPRRGVPQLLPRQGSVPAFRFAATPPLEAKKMLFSLAVTEGVGFKKGRRQQGMKIDFIDIKRAYFHSPARRTVYVKLPNGDDTPGTCG